MKPPKYRKNSITRYRLIEEPIVGKDTEAVQNYDLLSMVMLHLGGPDGENYDGVLRMLDVLLSDETSETEKRWILQDDYDIQMTQTMEKEVSVMCNLSKGVMEKGIAKGIAKGRAEGRVEGRAEGRAEGILTSLKSLMDTMGLTMEQAMTALKIPELERQKYADLLSKQ